MAAADNDGWAWEDIPWLADVLLFARLADDVVGRWPAVWVVTLYLLLSNMYDVHLSELNEYAVVSSDVFQSFFASRLFAERAQTPSGTQAVPPGQDCSSGGCGGVAVDANVKCLLDDDNHALSPPQKTLVRSMLESLAASPAEGPVGPAGMKFHIYVGNVDGRVHMVQCACCAHEFAQMLASLLAAHRKRRRDWDAAVAPAGEHSPSDAARRVLAEVSQHQVDAIRFKWHSKAPPSARQSCHGLAGARRSGSHRVVTAAAALVLYALMPHALACRVLVCRMRAADMHSLFELSAIVDRLVLNFPKEVDVWSLKLRVARECFRRLLHTQRGSPDLALALLGEGCLGIAPLLTAASARAPMNARLVWFARHLYSGASKLALHGVRGAAARRARDRLDAYFFALYAQLLVANRGYQGIFSLCLELVKGRDGSLVRLRHLCEEAPPNDSWQANLAALNALGAVYGVDTLDEPPESQPPG